MEKERNQYQLDLQQLQQELDQLKENHEKGFYSH